MRLCNPQDITSLAYMLKYIPLPHLCVHLCLPYVYHLSHYYNKFKMYLYHKVQERLVFIWLLIVYAIPLDVKVI